MRTRGGSAVLPRITMAAISVVMASCAQEQPAPFAEVLVVVDTDLPVPMLASRLRVDLFDDDGKWTESRDVGRPEPTDWPATFSVYSPDERHETHVIVRLRAYPEGITRDYRGERYADIDGEPVDGPNDEDVAPRLERDGRDVTPASEPKPTATVDRLVVLKLTPGVRGRTRVTLRGACAGTMTLLGHTAPYQKLVPWEAETCTDTEGVREHPAIATIEEDMSVPPATALGTFPHADGCDETKRGTNPRAECIPGGAFLMGSFITAAFNPPYASVPERVHVIDRFWLDRKEVSVAQMRAAVAAGLHSARPIVHHEAALGKRASGDLYDLDVWCTYTTAPSTREDLPMNCVDWGTARAYCQFVGGDLPSEAQWEYAGSVAGKPFKSFYPWGDQTPTCEGCVYSRTAFSQAPECPGFPEGPAAVGTTLGDVTPAGIFDLGGNVAEILRDDLALFTSRCWTAAPLANPVCGSSTSHLHAMRGGAFVIQRFGAQVTGRNDDGTESARSAFGFRCAFTDAPGKP